MSERRGATVGFVKAHACGNDFLFSEEGEVEGAPLDGLARAICGRRHGVGADGLIVYRSTPAGAAMRLFNADGSPAEVSGNGVRCLGALLVDTAPGVVARAHERPIEIETAAGLKTLTLLDAQRPRYTFRAGMGRPRGLHEEVLEVDGEDVRVVVLSVGNPQCVVLSPSMDEGERRFRRFGRLLAAHERFPAGDQRGIRDGGAPRSGSDPDLGAGRRADAGLGHRGVRGRGGCGPVRRRRPADGGRLARRSAARRLDGG